ncbi:MAG: hypothetical protein K2J20_03735 [Bacilli bacterium]|nr:hypothetical protein [Bacilli bacterium]
MKENQNALVRMFEVSYNNMSEAVNSSIGWLERLCAVNTALDALYEAKDYLPEIDRRLISNTLMVAMSYQKNYQDRNNQEVKDLQECLEKLKEASITRENFPRRG